MDFPFINAVILFLSAVLIAFLLNILLGKKETGKALNGRQNIPPKTETTFTPCPLCGTMLNRTEKVKSVVYPGKKDRLVEIFGCPYCIPPAEKARTCPVCKKRLGPDDFVVGRMFETSGKPHIHVNGCTKCMKKH